MHYPAALAGAPRVGYLYGALESGFDELLDTLAAIGADGLALPGVDEPMAPARYVRTILAGGREEGWDFDRSWSAAINRLQPTLTDAGAIDLGAASQLREERALLEDQRGLFRAAFEQRPPTARERAESLAGSWRREATARRFPIADEAA